MPRKKASSLAEETSVKRGVIEEKTGKHMTVIDDKTPEDELQNDRKPALLGSGPEALLAHAVSSGANIDTIERLMEMRKELLKEHAIKAFNESMAAFQAECPVIEKKKDVKNEHGKKLYSYAPLDSIVSQVKKLLQKHGFSYTIKTKVENGTITVTCVVKHKEGHTEESDLQVPSTGGTSIMSGPQKTAAALTFAKRYAFCNAFGIMTGDEDTDATPEPSPEPVQAPEQEDDMARRRRQAHAVWAEFMQAKGITNKPLIQDYRHKAMALLFKERPTPLEHMNEMNRAELNSFIAVVTAWTKDITEPKPAPVDTAEAAQEVFREEKPLPQPAAPKTPPSPAVGAKRATMPEEDAKGFTEWLEAATSGDELEAIWQEVKVEQVRLKEAKLWMPLHQLYIKRRVALQKSPPAA